MLPQWIRVLYGDNGAILDCSIEAQNSTGFTAALVNTQDYIYIGQYYPFNNLYVDIKTSNTITSTISAEYWASDEWISCVDILDDTKVSGKTFAQSGVITWSPDDEEMWTEVQDTGETLRSVPTELNGVTIYNLYWMRFKVSASLSPTTTVGKIGYMFSRNSVLASLDPDINEYLTAWKAGKSDWLEQMLIASDILVLDLKGRGLIRSPAQIMRFDEIYIATAWKTLSLIYNGLGDKFKDKKDYANNQYLDIINRAGLIIDQKNNAFADKNEIRRGMLVR